jgi:nitrogen fixation/metabolism regulation signal transduction histidine kinase
MKILHKMFIAPAAAILCLILVGVISLLSMAQQNSRMLELKDVTFAGFRSASNQTIVIGKIHSDVYQKMAIMGSLDEPAIKQLSTMTAKRIDDFAQKFEQMRTHARLGSVANEALPIVARYKSAVINAIDLASMDANTGVAAMQNASDEYVKLKALMDNTLEVLEQDTTKAIESSNTANARMLWVIAIVIVAALGGVSYMTLKVAHNATEPLNQAVTIAQTVAAGNFDVQIDASAEDEVGDMMRALNSMVEYLSATDAKMKGEVLIQQTAIATASASLMIVDPHGKIIYLNQSVTQLMSDAESDISKALPQFSSHNLLGAVFTNIFQHVTLTDSYFASLSNSQTSEMKFGRRTFMVVVNPIFDAVSKRLGTVIEWRDRTLELAAESEIADVVGSAGMGDFSPRIDEVGKTGFFLTLAHGVNQLMQTTETGLSEIARVMGALSNGDLTQKISSA